MEERARGSVAVHENEDRVVSALQAEIKLLIAQRLRQSADMNRKRTCGQEMIPVQRLSIRRLDL